MEVVTEVLGAVVAGDVVAVVDAVEEVAVEVEEVSFPSISLISLG